MAIEVCNEGIVICNSEGGKVVYMGQYEPGKFGVKIVNGEICVSRNGRNRP